MTKTDGTISLDCGGDLKDQKDVISVSSDYYAGLASHYRQVTEEWMLQERKRSGLTRWSELRT